MRAWRLTSPQYWRRQVSTTFHGRDIFAPVAAHLAAGTPPEALGTPLERPVRLALPAVQRAAGGIVGRIVHIDHFGNAITDLRREDLPGPPAACRVSAGPRVVEGIASTYAAVAPGEPVALFGSFETLEVACRDGHAAGAWGLHLDQRVVVRPIAPAAPPGTS